jgi:hypothetical protein
MENNMDFITNTDWSAVLVTAMTIWGAFVTFASAVVKVTPTTKDDAILEKLVKFAEIFSIFNRKK